ncbi:MAG TPA: hypothetical protein VGP72_31230 [Planctomycetota bacterium]|jgi:translation elongation factor EF-Tu-like GTPase
MGTPFDMDIRDVFYIGGGRVVVAGLISGGDKYIRACQCEVLVEGRAFANIAIEGEWMTEKASDISDRAVSTTDDLKLDRELIARGVCKLRSVQQ